MIQETGFAEQVLALAMVLLTLPLFADLLVGIAGNLRRLRASRTPCTSAVRLAVVVPAHDEEPMIARTVRSLLAAGCSAYAARAANENAQAGWEIPVFVVAHNCTDRTAVVAAGAGAQVIELNKVEVSGKAAALRRGFAAARIAGANAFLVVDADSVVSPNLIAASRAALDAGAAATQCRYELELPASGSIGMRARLRVLAFRGINVLRARGRANLGFSAGVFGNGFAVTDETLGRVPFSVDSICEDMEYHVRLVSAGLSVRWVEDAFVHAPLAPGGSARATQEARWEGGRFHVATRATGKLSAAVLGGNWRALGMISEAWSLPLSRGILALVLMAFLPVHWLHIYAIACAAVVLAYVLGAVLMGNEPWRDLAALACTPLHLVWKLAITPLVLRQSRVGAEWARTRREVRAP